MPKPAGQYAKIENTTTGFSAFTVGGTVLVKNTSLNDGIYTVNVITDDGLHSYMGLSGPAITRELDQTDVDIIPSGLSGDKLIGLGDEDSGSVNVWSYNSSSSTTGTIIESGSAAVDVGTSGWSANAITPVLNGAVSKFVFTPGQSALRVCDSTLENSGVIKHFKYYQTVQFRNCTSTTYSDRASSIYSEGKFSGWEEHENTLPKPVSGGLLLGTVSNIETHVNPSQDTFYGLPSNGEAGDSEYSISTDFHLVRSLNEVIIVDSSDNDISSNGSYGIIPLQTCQLKVTETKNPTAAQSYLKVQDSSLAKIPIGAVIGLSNENGIIDEGTTRLAEKMLVRNIDVDTSRIYVYRGYGSTAAATITLSSTPYLLQYGCGFNYSVFPNPSNSGSYSSGDYEFAQSFVYDGNQESLLRTKEDFVTTTPQILSVVADFFSFKIRVGFVGPYPARVTGGRIYTRIADSEEPWSLLVDIDLEKGCRTGMSGEYRNFQHPESLTVSEKNNCFHCGSVAFPLVSNELQLDKYQDINNYYPDIDRNSIGYMGESYQCSTIGGERAWYGNMKLVGATGVSNRYGDKIMYSEYRKFDVVPHLNYFIASEGDAEDIVELKYFANKLFVFKSKSLHIWNVSNNEPGNWFPEQTVRTGGISHPCSVVDTPYGLVWANRTGCYYYDGKQLFDLTEQKIRDTENSYHGASLPPSWASFAESAVYSVNPLVVYSPKDKQVYIMKDPTESGGSEHLCYIYNFLTKAWTFNNSIFYASPDIAYTNPIIDWNNNAVVAYESVADSGFELGTAFDKDEIITEDDDSRFNGAGAGANWGNYGAAAGFVHDALNNRLQITHTSDTSTEGAVLDGEDDLELLIAGSTYRIEFDLHHAAPVDAMEDVVFIVELGGSSVEIGTIDTVKARYSVDMAIANHTGDLIIHHSFNNDTIFYISRVSVKCITLDLDADASSKIVVGDRLQVESEDFHVIEVNTDKIVTETGYAGTTAADHASGTQVDVYRAVFNQISPASIATAAPAFITKDFDFDEPGRVKKIYKIYITYMNSGLGALANKIKVAANGNTTFAQTSISTPNSASTFALTGTFLASRTSWVVTAFTFDNPFPCQSIALYFNDGATVNGLSINDISFEYRTIHKRVS